jgi:group I intron endonuclease
MLAFGIYLWRNKIDGRVLVGQTGSTKGFLRRKSQYLSDLRSGRYMKKNKHFQRAWNKYGKNNFEFIILEILYNDKHLTAYEQSFVNYYKTLPGGIYNQSGPVDNPLRGATIGPCSEEKRAKYHLQIAVGPNRQYQRRLEINYLIPSNINGKQ